MEKNFKKGDEFIPRKPKDVNEYPLWQPCMDLLNGKTLVIENITSNGEISAECCLFHPDWCEKVEDTHIPDVREIVDSLELPNNQDHIVEANKMIDWEQRRYELAKSAMQGMTTNEYYLEICASKAEDNKTEWENILCSNAINVADEMIKQLKGE